MFQILDPVPPLSITLPATPSRKYEKYYCLILAQPITGHWQNILYAKHQFGALTFGSQRSGTFTDYNTNRLCPSVRFTIEKMGCHFINIFPRTLNSYRVYLGDSR